MSLIEKRWYVCDSCGTEVKVDAGTSAFIEYGHGCQIWPTENGELHICPNCCIRLDTFVQLGIVPKINVDFLYEKAGFTKSESGSFWVKTLEHGFQKQTK